MFDDGVIVSKMATDAVDEQQKFKMYYDYREPVKQIPSHRMLAISRGETEDVLYFLIEMEAARALALIQRKVHKRAGDWTPHLQTALD
jgi:protein Tex